MAVTVQLNGVGPSSLVSRSGMLLRPSLFSGALVIIWPVIWSMEKSPSSSVSMSSVSFAVSVSWNRRHPASRSARRGGRRGRWRRAADRWLLSVANTGGPTLIPGGVFSSIRLLVCLPSFIAFSRPRQYPGTWEQRSRKARPARRIRTLETPRHSLSRASLRTAR